MLHQYNDKGVNYWRYGIAKTDRLRGVLKDGQTEKQTEKQTERKTERKKDRKRERKKERRRDRKTERKRTVKIIRSESASISEDDCYPQGYAMEAIVWTFS